MAQPLPTPTPTPPPGFQLHSLPRLDPSCYRAAATILWTFPTANRAQGWLNQILHLKFRELLLHATIRHSLLCPVYTLMPDHLHLALIGTSPKSDQRNAISFLRTHLEPLIHPAKFQHQPHDHVLTREERAKNAFARTCQYILLNPQRANLVPTPEAWPYSGCILPGYANITPFDENYWPLFWKIFQKQRDPACDKHTSIRRSFSKSPSSS